MCGIAGLLGIDPSLSGPAAERMRDALRHRGPDDEGIVRVQGRPGQAEAVLVHTRLSIVDLSPAGHQPMADPPSNGGTAESNFLTYNGEVYNFRELASELEREGRACRSRSDTEVVLHAYRAWGVRAVERFAGMFAFCLLDPAHGVAWLCRDRLGIKPLYLFRPASGGLIFASEMRAILAAGAELVPRRLRRAAVESYLAQGAVMGEASLVEGVTLLPPGESLLCDFEGRPVRSVRYWSVAFGDDAGATTQAADGMSTPAASGNGAVAAARWRSELVTELKLALRHSVKSQLLADVPVGLFLSAGVNSGSLAAIASEVASEPLRTLSVGFDMPEFDESSAAALTARDLGTQHRHLELTGAETLASFDSVLDALDQPTVDGFNTFHVSRAAKRAGLTVALSGLGGDELFGGYASFSDVPRALGLARAARFLSPNAGARNALAHAISTVHSLPGLSPRKRALAKLSETLRRPAELVGLYFLRRELMTRDERRSLHALPSESDPWCGIERDTLQSLQAGLEQKSAVDRVAGLELGMYMRHMLLRDADVFSMANNIELRVPLLEHRVVEHAARARSAWRVPDPRPKPLLLDAVGSRLPVRAWQAKKQGFTFPWAPWLRGPLRERIELSLGGEGLRAAGLDVVAARRLWLRFLAGDTATPALSVLALVVLESLVRREGLAA